MLHNRLRRDDDMSALGCIVQCLLACIEEIIDYLNDYGTSIFELLIHYNILKVQQYTHHLHVFALCYLIFGIAFVYVGLYGYSYLEAGKNVLQLFTNKGWSVLYTDALCDFVLFMICCCIGLLTGLFGYFIASKDNMLLGIGISNDIASVFGIVFGVLVGYVTSSIIMGIILSAVNTILGKSLKKCKPISFKIILTFSLRN